jgi:hypothetical protein
LSQPVLILWNFDFCLLSNCNEVSFSISNSLTLTKLYLLTNTSGNIYHSLSPSLFFPFSHSFSVFRSNKLAFSSSSSNHSLLRAITLFFEQSLSSSSNHSLSTLFYCLLNINHYLILILTWYIKVDCVLSLSSLSFNSLSSFSYLFLSPISYNI